MEYAQLGSTEIVVSRVALGTWAIGGWLWGGTDVEDAIKAIHEAWDLGITTVDTAAVYGFGLSEEILGRALQQRGMSRDKLVIATKAGMEWDGEQNVRRNSRPERIREEIEDSLRRLQTDYVDLYQIHWPDPQTPIEETARVMNRLYEEGKIRAMGVSNYSADQMTIWRQAAPLHSCQPLYNVLERDSERDILPYCRAHDLAVLVYSPLARGLLTGKFSEQAAFPPGDSRGRERRFQGETFARSLRIVAQLKVLAAGMGKSVAQLAVRWLLDQEGVTVALWGARRPGQIAEAAGACDWSLTDGQLQEIDRIVATSR